MSDDFAAGGGDEVGGAADGFHEGGRDAPDHGHAAAGFRAVAEGDHGHAGALAGHHARGATGRGVNDNRGDFQRTRSHVGGVGNHLLDAVTQFKGVGCGELVAGPGHFGALGNSGHDLHGLDRKFADRGFSGKHDGVGAIENRVGDVGGFGAGGFVIVGHGLQHLRGGDHGFATASAGGDDAFLGDGHVLNAHFQGEVTAGHHHGIGGFNNGFDFVEGALFFDFGHDRYLRTMIGKNLFEQAHVVGGLHEGKREIIEALFNGEFDVDEIFFRDGWTVDPATWKIDAAIAGELAAAGDLGEDDAVIFNGHNTQFDIAIIENDHGTGFDIILEGGKADTDAFGCSQLAIGVEAEHVVFHEKDFAVLHFADTDAGASKVAENADGLIKLCGGFADGHQSGDGGLMFGVGEVDAKNIYAGDDQFFDHFGTAAGGPEGGDDFGSSANDFGAHTFPLMKIALIERACYHDRMERPMGFL